MGVFKTWLAMAEADMACDQNDKKTRPYRREGNLIFLLKEDEERLPFTPENDKLALLLYKARENAGIARLRRALGLHPKGDDRTEEE